MIGDAAANSALAASGGGSGGFRLDTFVYGFAKLACLLMQRRHVSRIGKRREEFHRDCVCLL